MRMYRIGGGVLVIALLGVVAAALSSAQITHAGSNIAVDTITRDDASQLTLRVLNWMHPGALVSRDELPAYPATKFIVIDLRTAQDYARDHIPGAINLPPEYIIAEIGSLVPDPNRPILIYGYDENHSVRSVIALRLFAYNDVVHLQGGWPVQIAAN